MNDIIFIHMALGLLTINILFLTFHCWHNTKEIKKLKKELKNGK